MRQQFDILFDPVVPVWLIAAGLAMAGVLLALLWRAGLSRIGISLRAVLALVLAAMLLDPKLRTQETEPLADIALIVADHSASQRLDKRLERTRAATRLLQERLAALPNTEVRTHILPADDGTRGTRLIGALKKALAGIPPERFAGAFLLTDGLAHDMPAEVGRALPEEYAGAPVHALITGRRDERDRWVRIVRAGRYGIIGKTLAVRFEVKELPSPRGPRRVRVRVRLDGRPLRDLTVPTGVSTTLRVPVRHAGQNVLEIIAEPMSGGAELTLRNNHVVHVFKGVRDRLKVLLISGKPHAGERIWRNLLKSDPMVDLVHFTILRPPAKQDGTPISELALIAFPTYELFVEKLHNFDLIIFDRYRRRSILSMDYLQNVVDYVRNGGAVLFTAGPEFAGDDSLFHTPLAEMLPFAPTGRIIEGPYRAQVSAVGLRHPLTTGLGQAKADETPPWGRWFRLIEARMTGGDGAQVLMRGPGNRPLLTAARIGEGRVAALLSDHVWLWARKYDGGGPHVELMRRLVHWLMKEPDLEEEQLRARLEGADLVIARRTLADRPPPLEVRTPDGRTLRPEWRERGAGMFEARVPNAAPGLYHFQSGELARTFPVGAADVTEFRNLVAGEDILAPLARRSGGGIRWIAAGGGEAVRLPGVVKMDAGAGMAGRGWLGVARRNAARVLAVRHYPLFTGLLALAGLLLLLGVAWRLESR